MISVNKLEKRYEAVHAVKSVSFEVARGDIVGLLGQNGAGKTTVMKILTGYLEPTAGTVTVGGADVQKDRLAVQRQIGYLPENAPLYPEMLVQEYLLMMCELRGLPPEKHIAAVSDAVRATGLVPYLTRPIATLSKGYRQRVGLAQAIVHKPDVLVLDEPTNGLDPVQIQEIRGLIKRLAQHSTIILSTHILQEVEAVCNRVVILINGELAADATLADLLKSRRVRVSLKQGTDGAAVALGKVTGITQVTRRGADPDAAGFDLWSCEFKGEASPVQEIIELAVERKWIVGGVAPESSNLESVFRTLMSEKAVAKTDANVEAAA